MSHVCQAGIIEEMTDDMFTSTMDDDELDDEATEEVDKILWELTAGMWDWMPHSRLFLIYLSLLGRYQVTLNVVFPHR